MSDNPNTAADTGPVEGKASGESPEGQSTSAGQSGKPGTLFQRLSSIFRPKNGSSIREDLADALDDHEIDAAEFSPGERAMLKNILTLRELRVEDVMIPRADIEAVDAVTPLSEVMVMFEQSGRSRMPVYDGTLDDPRGMIHIRDVLAYLTRAGRAPGEDTVSPAARLDLVGIELARSIDDLGLVRPLLFVPPSMLASELMARMQAARIQMALVIDEYGGTDGLVSLEDIVEMVVGDIEDEHDDDEPMITRSGEGVFIVDAKAEIDDVAEVIGDSFVAGEFGEHVDTIGGMLSNALGRVPAKDEVVEAIPGFEFHVLDADPRRVKRVRIVQVGTPENRLVS